MLCGSLIALEILDVSPPLIADYVYVYFDSYDDHPLPVNDDLSRRRSTQPDAALAGLLDFQSMPHLGVV